jgi:hypothetical protein
MVKSGIDSSFKRAEIETTGSYTGTKFGLYSVGVAPLFPVKSYTKSYGCSQLHRPI